MGDGSNTDGGWTRRAWLSRVGVGVGVGVGLAAGLGARSAHAWLSEQVPAGAPVGPLLEHTSRPANLETASDLLAVPIVPVEHFYVRSHFDVPFVQENRFRLRVGGAVEKPVELDLAGLKQRFKEVSLTAVLQCAGNGRAFHRPRVGGVQWRRGACGNATWTGVRLRDVLASAGVKGGAVHLQMSGADRPALPSVPRFIRSVPIDKALHPDSLLAYAMNGAPLRRAHGFPLRVVLPGWVGDDWMKWVDELTVQDQEASGFYMEKGYRFPSQPLAPGATPGADIMRPMTEMNVKSIVATPVDGAELPAGRHEITGVAFSGEAHVTRVEISVDGEPWRPATLEGPATNYAWRVFRAPWEAGAGTHSIRARATDSRGAVQPDDAAWNPGGYLWNAIETIRVTVRAA